MSDAADVIPVAEEIERAAAHEAGHAVVSLSLDVAVERIEMLAKENMPLALRRGNFELALAVKYSKAFEKLEPRRQYLIAVGGVAAEVLMFQKYCKIAAAEDFDALKATVLSEADVEGLIAINQKLLSANLKFFHRLRGSIQRRVETSTDGILLHGAAINANFKKKGVRPDVTAELYALLPE